MSEPMTCSEAEPLLPLVADGAIDPDSDPALFAHLASCPGCQRIVASHDLIALAIARPAPPPRRRATILRWWPYAAAACLALAVLGALRANASGPPASIAPPTTVVAGPVAPAYAQPVPVAAPAVPEVIAVPRADGTTLYLVRRDGVWVALDPAALDGPVRPGHGDGAGVQVRY